MAIFNSSRNNIRYRVRLNLLFIIYIVLLLMITSGNNVYNKEIGGSPNNFYVHGEEIPVGAEDRINSNTPPQLPKVNTPISTVVPGTTGGKNPPLPSTSGTTKNQSSSTTGSIPIPTTTTSSSSTTTGEPNTPAVNSTPATTTTSSSTTTTGIPNQSTTTTSQPQPIPLPSQKVVTPPQTTTSQALNEIKQSTAQSTTISKSTTFYYPSTTTGGQLGNTAVSTTGFNQQSSTGYSTTYRGTTTSIIPTPPKIEQSQVVSANISCKGVFCPNGACVSSLAKCLLQSNGIISRCPMATPIRCPDGTCSHLLTLCLKPSVKCDEMCPNGQCGPCPEYDGCPVASPIQCPNGICVANEDDCDQCLDGSLKCFDGSCSSPCPLPPFFYKPINVLTILKDITKILQVPVSTYNDPLNVSTDLRKILDVFIEPNTFSINTSFAINAVSDSYVSKIESTFENSSEPSGSSSQTALHLLSPVYNITATSSNGTAQTKFDKKVRLDFDLITSLNESVIMNNVCLGFINVLTNKWECIPNSIQGIQDNKIVTYTDHFTSFALLLQYRDDSSFNTGGDTTSYVPIGTSGGSATSSSSSGKTSDPNSIFPNKNKPKLSPLAIGLIVGCTVACLVIVLAGVVYHYSGKHNGLRNWIVASRLISTKSRLPVPSRSSNSLTASTSSSSSSCSTSPTCSPPHKTLSHKDLGLHDEEVEEVPPVNGRV
ncbi:phosphatidylinositol 3-kinase 2 [Cavenderia fasciculata]|uniref:Phosphatidylinositol 3-kinase 2 n=1 Tax=Cavenderia fasciculata TaxID=261658 RepID=F4Q0Y1_CACFS|nr:phosphatidylinositol 3-kinase 2 [Cavenderia fasciculata]EGG18482.1 phosphatidylinositol 3-kinase 2 [Cavenderia fasciculata]|eukprot:XP_004366386.1 phosphatidylinositol 3-kinase 2 [Cavenderia fasciculata]